jgi:hypothetical protein
MSSQNAFPGPNSGRPPARPTTPASNSQPSWVNPQAQPVGRPQQPGSAWPPQQQPAPAYPDYPQQQGYGGQQPAPQQPASQYPAYDQWNDQQRGVPNQGGTQGTYGGYPQSGGQQDPYAPQFEPYVPPSRPNFSQPPQQRQPGPAFTQPQAAPQWPARDAESRGFDAGNYGMQQSYPGQQPGHASPTFGQQQYHDNTELSAADWAGPHDQFAPDPYQQHGDPQLGFGQADGGELEPAYNDEEYEYEDEEPAPRGRRSLMIVAALIGAIVIGGGVAYGYKKLAGGGVPEGDPPIVKSDDFAAKTKPADAGGKQFPYSDTKIMGRLGDGTSSASASEANGAPEGASAGAPDAAAQDPDGPRKVSTLVVGRDGSIMASATPTEDQGQAPAPTPPQQQGGTAVPGTSLVDVFGQQQQGGGAGAPPPAANRPQSEPDGADDSAPAKRTKPVKVTTINAPDADDTPAPPKKKYKKVARAEPTVETDATADAPPVTTHSGTGFVAVLASIPHSSSSRIDALKRFADMQQKYSAALSGKTPDIASANLSKGVYDRLVVGPPGSREQASNVCTQLKAEGYQSCWVTAY